MSNPPDPNATKSQAGTNPDGVDKIVQECKKLLESHVKEQEKLLADLKAHEKLLTDLKTIVDELGSHRSNTPPWGVRAKGTATTLIATAIAFGLLGYRVMNQDMGLPQLGALLFLCLLWCVICIAAGLLIRRFR